MTKKSKMIISHSPEQTKDIARQLGEHIPAGTVIAAYGELGMGKTCFASGLARGLNINDKIISPTYIIYNVYLGEPSFAHIDAYRLENLSEEEIALTGIEECFIGKKVIFVEWPGFIREWLPESIIELRISHGDSDIERLIEIVYDNVEQRWVDEAFSN